jgi:transposase
MKFTMREFNERFSTSDDCLDFLMSSRYGKEFVCPKCKEESKFFKIKGRQVYSCMYCRYQISPLAGTIFHKSSTDLRTWFLAIFLMSTTRTGISAKQLERMTGVTYKCAHRMFKQIRSLMADDHNDPLSGIVEIDEAYIGGVRKGKTGMGAAKEKGGVMGMVERGGRLRGEVIHSVKYDELMPKIKRNVAPKSTVMTDQLGTYRDLPYQGYQHWFVNHGKHEYARGIVSTNTIEGFWGNFKKAVEGVYRHVDVRYLQNYVDEFAFRYSNRKSEVPMFDLVLARTLR